MQLAGELLSDWNVRLHSGHTVQVWADGYTEEADSFVFSALVDATETEQANLDITARTPSNPERVIIVIARFPTDSVDSILSA